MLTIRLQRVGKTKHALYRVIVSEKSRDPWGTNLEILGTHDPHLKDGGLKLKTDRITYWLSKGAQTSATIHNLLVENGLLKSPKRKVVYLSGKRKAKLGGEKKTKEKMSSAQ